MSSWRRDGGCRRLLWSIICACHAIVISAYKNDAVVDDKNVAIVGGGCFWCLEAVFQRQLGVVGVVSGYIGGDESGPTPNYKMVSSGRTQWVEAVKITFDGTKTSYRDLLDTFFAAHDPTTVNRQGGDSGPQYRSAIFFLDKAQETEAKAAIKRAEVDFRLGKRQGDGGQIVVTELSPAGRFWDVVELEEHYHHNFYNKCVNGNCYHRGYNEGVVKKKLKKLQLPLGHSGHADEL
eukprot:TRINITY_DN52373_c0_g1_i1.p1 TRINITY_DN52373_c0_g1~~TRINITY_DN52373_c0_g1_i1.p1  ORF type:complete len:235 (+),score=44.95 TRINITY_DN52373_c0_g1_i1:110-814(+)